MIRTFFICLALIAISFPASAYDCWIKTPLYKQIRDADLVFIGRVTAIDDMPPAIRELNTPRHNITFDVYHSWKKNTPATVEVDTESFYNYHFKMGNYYFVMAYALYPNRYSIVGCPRVEPITETRFRLINQELDQPEILRPIPSIAFNNDE